MGTIFFFLPCLNFAPSDYKFGVAYSSAFTLPYVLTRRYPHTPLSIYLIMQMDQCVVWLFCTVCWQETGFFCAVDLDHLTFSSDPLWFGHTNKTHRREQFMKLLVLQFASSSCHFFPLWFTYSLQPPLFEDLQFCVLPLTWETKFCMCQNSR